MDLKLTNVQFLQMQAPEVEEVIGSALMLDLLPPLEEKLYTKAMFTSAFTPVDVVPCRYENTLTYFVKFEMEPAPSTTLWCVQMEGFCAENIDYVCLELEEPLENGKRGGQIVLIKPSMIDRGGCI